MASEDTEKLVSGFTPVHRLHDLDDLNKTRVGLVPAARHQFDARSKLLEVALLGGTKRILPEKRDDPLDEITPTVNHVAVQRLPVVVVSPVDVNLSHSEVVTYFLETASARGALCHDEVV